MTRVVRFTSHLVSGLQYREKVETRPKTRRELAEGNAPFRNTLWLLTDVALTLPTGGAGIAKNETGR